MANLGLEGLGFRPIPHGEASTETLVSVALSFRAKVFLFVVQPPLLRYAAWQHGGLQLCRLCHHAGGDGQVE